ncbi:hypothetical protein LZ554_001872 [Drepanopeziza brunnea f. sp. 'monogermtubi']|nr:hypothetical protein LZ554_001872 [Drepanopeziza brunnea f. sp. 'monogermtubi']
MCHPNCKCNVRCWGSAFIRQTCYEKRRWCKDHDHDHDYTESGRSLNERLLHDRGRGEGVCLCSRWS